MVVCGDESVKGLYFGCYISGVETSMIVKEEERRLAEEMLRLMSGSCCCMS